MNNSTIEAQKKYNKWIVALSITIPVVVAALFGIKLDMKLPIFLPPIYATINGITAIVLITALIQIKRGKRIAHEWLMKSAIVMSVLFLVMYVLYHMTSDTTVFGDLNHNGQLDLNEKDKIGGSLYIYRFILISHIILSITVIPFVLITYVRAITNDFKRHKKIAKITFPIWLYVAVTGVIVYLMISPYYQF